MKFYVTMFALLLLSSCKQSHKQLPVLGTPVITGSDTSYPTIADFTFTDQDGQTVTNQTFANKIYVADFIFLSCPTICPKMTKEMHNVFRSFASNDKILFISYSIDPIHDSVPRLKAYASSLGVSSSRWHFVTGNQDSIINLSEHSYFSAAYPDSTTPGGFTHSGGLLLVDKNRHIRGVYNATRPEETNRLINDIQILLKEDF